MREPERKRSTSVRSYFSNGDGFVRWTRIYDKGRLGYFASSVRERKRLVVDLIEQFGTSALPRVLDIGCGCGEISISLLRRGYHVMGVDCSAEMVRSSRQKAAESGFVDNCLFVNADIEALPYGDDCFDIVICVGVLSYLSEIDHAVQEIRRVLKTGGLAVLTFRNRNSLSRLLDVPAHIFSVRDRLRRLLMGPPGGHNGGRPTENPYLIEETGRYDVPWRINTLLSRNGFQILTHQGAGYGPIRFAGYPFLRKTLFPAFQKLQRFSTRSGSFKLLRYLSNLYILALRNQ